MIGAKVAGCVGCLIEDLEFAGEIKTRSWEGRVTGHYLPAWNNVGAMLSVNGDPAALGALVGKRCKSVELHLDTKGRSLVVRYEGGKVVAGA